MASCRHVIHFNGSINPITAYNIKDVTLKAMHVNSQQGIPAASELYYIFSSTGGDAAAGIDLYNFLRGIHIPITIHNFSSMDSIASLVFLAANTRYVVPSGRFLLHKFSMTPTTGTYDSSLFEELAMSLNSYMDIYASIFKERVNGIEKLIDFNAVFKGNSIILDASISTEFGIAHKIIPPDNLISPYDTSWWVAP